MSRETYCANGGADAGRAERRTAAGAVFILCSSCKRVLKPTGTDKFRQHQPRTSTTRSLDRTRDALWAYAKEVTDART